MALEGKNMEQVVMILLAPCNALQKNICLQKVLAIIQINEYNRVYG